MVPMVLVFCYRPSSVRDQHEECQHSCERHSSSPSWSNHQELIAKPTHVQRFQLKSKPSIHCQSVFLAGLIFLMTADV